MEITWKVCWISCLLFLSSSHLSVSADEETTTKISSTESTAEVEDEKSSQGDLDLETQDQVAILKQINRVNDDGSYTFGYEAADGSFKIETRDVNGNVKGMFGFINENGELKRVSYSASNGTGFQSTGTLNIPPLPGTTLNADDDGTNRRLYDQILRIKKPEESATKINLLEPTTSAFESSPEVPSTRIPIYIYGSSTPPGELTSPARPVVIQHIPKVRPTPATSSTAPTESEEILRKPLFPNFAPQRTSNGNFISFGSNEITSTTPETPTTEEGTRHPSVIQVIRPRTGPFKKVIVTKRPIATTTPKVVTTTDFQSKEYLQKLKEKETSPEPGNGVRRQLGITTNNYVTPTYPSQLTSGTEDSPDVYGGGHTSRPYPANAYRTLFTQIPQHQRILQNSFIQNQNQYLAAAFGNVGGVQPAVTPQVLPQPVPQTPNQGRTYGGGPAPVPQDGNIPPRQNNFVPAPISPQLVPDPQGQRPIGVSPNYIRQPYPPPMAPIVPPQPEQPFNQLYIPPGLLEHLIRMLLAAQQRQRQQSVSPFQQAVLATLGPGNVPPELLDNRYDPRYYQPSIPYPNYSQVPYPYPVPMIPRQGYDPYYQGLPYLPVDPRYGYQTPMYSPIYPRFPSPLPYNPIDPARSQQGGGGGGDDFVLRMLFGYPRFQAQIPVPPVQNPTNVVERSPVYQAPGRDSTTSSTTPAPRLGPVRNVQILGQITEDSETTSNFEESTKPGE